MHRYVSIHGFLSSSSLLSGESQRAEQSVVIYVRKLRDTERQASMGLCHRASEISAYASLHAVHVRRWSADIQHGHSLYVALESIQESRSH